MATIRVGDSTTMYYKDWGEGLFRMRFAWLAARFRRLGRADAFLAQNGFRVS
jgi:hypothetical protein